MHTERERERESMDTTESLESEPSTLQTACRADANPELKVYTAAWLPCQMRVIQQVYCGVHTARHAVQALI